MKKLGPQTTQSPSHLHLISSDEIKQEILNLNNKKVPREGDVPVNILKE